MVAKRSTLLVALASVLVLAVAPNSAEARFGSRSGGGGGSGGRAGGSSGGGGYHGASGAGGGLYGPRYYGGYRYYAWPSFYYGWGFGYYPYYVYPPYSYYPYTYPVPAQPVVTQQAPGPTIKTTLALQSQTISSLNGGGIFATDRGGTFGASIGFEGQRFGVNAQFTSIFPDWNNGSSYFGADAIKLFNAYLTYAIVATPHSRLRIEAGAMSAFTPDLSVVGPGGGVSLVLNVFGPFGLEGAVHGTPYPYRELDWNAGLALTFGPLGLHGGWRRIFLDDKGLVDGIRNQDSFTGPYLGIGVTL